MLKDTLAMIVIGSFISSNSFAAPLHLDKLFMKSNVTNSSLAANNHNQNSKSKFSGTWAGTCSFNDKSQEMKIRVNEDENELSIVDLLNEGNNENYSFNRVVTENNSDNESYNSSTHRLTRVNKTTLNLENVDIYASQLPSANAEKSFTSALSTTMFTVNNNQLTMDINVTAFYKNKTANIDGKCIYKRIA